MEARTEKQSFGQLSHKAGSRAVGLVVHRLRVRSSTRPIYNDADIQLTCELPSRRFSAVLQQTRAQDANVSHA